MNSRQKIPLGLNNKELKILENYSTPIQAAQKQFELIMQESILESPLTDDLENLSYILKRDNANNDSEYSDYLSEKSDAVCSISSTAINGYCWSAPAGYSDYEEENNLNQESDIDDDLDYDKFIKAKFNFNESSENDEQDNDDDDKLELLRVVGKYNMIKQKKQIKKKKNISTNINNEFFGRQACLGNSWSSPCLLEKNENKCSTRNQNLNRKSKIKSKKHIQASCEKVNEIKQKDLLPIDLGVIETLLIQKKNDKEFSFKQNNNKSVEKINNLFANQLNNINNETNSIQLTQRNDDALDNVLSKVNNESSQNISSSSNIVLNKRNSVFQKDIFNKFYDEITKPDEQMFDNSNFENTNNNNEAKNNSESINDDENFVLETIKNNVNLKNVHSYVSLFKS